MKAYFIFLLVLASLLGTGCRDQQVSREREEQTRQESTALSRPGCQSCHQEIHLDKDHHLACTECHLGDNRSADKETAHQGLVRTPADQDQMQRTCGRCHEDQVRACAGSLHYTLRNMVNQTRAVFGLGRDLPSLEVLPEISHPVASVEQLVDDMLRRRCLRCHVHSPGDSYALVTRGQGCSSCHLRFSQGHLESHTFIRPTDRQCLSCHYGNHVGADYYGRYEQDFNWEYRTPYVTNAPFVRPYGVEEHELVADIHQQRGLVCIDCHDGTSLMTTDRQPVGCITCHGWQPGDRVPAIATLQLRDKGLVLLSRSGSGEHPVPGLSHPAHRQYNDRVGCQVCHAQWTFNDAATHLLLSYSDEVEEWERLTVQSSSEVEQWLDHNLNSDEEEWEPAMLDQLSGRRQPGIWLQGYGQRRWEELLICRDSRNMIQVCRPILDLRLSAVDADGNVLFDNIIPAGAPLPYTPHTTGPAGIFYRYRFSHLLPGDPDKAGRKKRE